jgi:hypothetical protein
MILILRSTKVQKGQGPILRQNLPSRATPKHTREPTIITITNFPRR